MIKALHHDGIFSGNGPGDMNLPYQMMRMLVIEAHAGLYGEKYVNLIELDGENCSLRQLSVAARRYETLDVDISGTEPLLAVHTLLPDDTVRDIYRIILTGETDTPPDLRRLYENLSEFFFELQLRDETRLRQSVWDKAGDDSLRALFLLKLRERYDAAKTEDERTHIEQAARWGLAAIDNREEVIRHDDP